MRIFVLLFVLLKLFSSTIHAQNNRFQNFFAEIDTTKNNIIALDKLQNLKQNNKLSDNEKLVFYDKIIPVTINLQKYYLTLKYSFQGLQLAEKLKNDSILSIFNMKVGNAYYYILNRKKAISYYNKSYYFAQKGSVWQQEAKALNNLSAMYIEENKLRKAEKTLTACITIFKKHNVLKTTGVLPLRLLGTLYFELKKYDEAKKTYEDVLKYSLENKDSSLYTFTLIYYSDLLMKLNLNKEALTMSKKALAIQRTLNDRITLGVVLSHYSNLLRQNKLNDEALLMYRELINLNKENYKENIKHDIANIEVKYKTQEIIREKELAETKTLNERNQKNIYFLAFVGILLLLSGSFLLIFYRQKLKQKNAEQELQKKHLIALIDAQEQEKVRIARDLHDGICQKFVVAKLKLNTLKEDYQNISLKGQENFDTALYLVDDALFETRGLAHEIMPPVLLSEGITEAIKQLCYQTFHPEIKYTFENFGNPIRLNPTNEINCYRIVQELFANIVKHAKASNVSVQLFAKNNKLTILVEDDGIGILENKMGMGFNNIDLRCKMLNAKFSIQNSPNGGTIASFILPF